MSFPLCLLFFHFLSFFFFFFFLFFLSYFGFFPLLRSFFIYSPFSLFLFLLLCLLSGWEVSGVCDGMGIESSLTCKQRRPRDRVHRRSARWSSDAGEIIRCYLILLDGIGVNPRKAVYFFILNQCITFLLHYIFPSIPHFSSILIYSTPTLSSLSCQTIPFTHFHPYLPFSFLSLVPFSPNLPFPFFFSLSLSLFHPFSSLFPLPFPYLIFFSLSLPPFHPFFLLSFSLCLLKDAYDGAKEIHTKRSQLLHNATGHRTIRRRKTQRCFDLVEHFILSFNVVSVNPTPLPSLHFWVFYLTPYPKPNVTLT